MAHLPSALARSARFCSTASSEKLFPIDRILSVSLLAAKELAAKELAAKITASTKNTNLFIKKFKDWPSESIVLRVNPEVGLRMFADRAHLRSFLSDHDVAAVSALPDDIIVL